jgi:diguanylate cyclase (GGDEF)-like protein/PAS domain S-box-containing protein
MTSNHPVDAHQSSLGGDDLDVARALLNEVDDLLFSVSVPEFRLTWANTTARAYFEHMRGEPEPTGKTPRQLAYDATRAAVFERWFSEAVEQGSVETDYRSPLDQRLWRLRVQAVTRQGRCVGLVVNGKDLSKEEDATRRASESESMYRSLFRCMGVGAVFQALDGRIIAVNHEAALIEGRSEDQMIGLTSDASDWDAVKDDGTPFPGTEHPSMVTLRTGQPRRNVVMGIRRPNGERRWLNINSEPVIDDRVKRPQAVVTTFHDITDRRKLEADLDATVSLLSKLTQRVPGVVYQFVLSPDGKARIPYASDHAWALMELRPEDVRDDAQPFFDRVYPDDIQALLVSIQQSARTLTHWRHEFRVVLPSNGQTIWMGGEAQPEKTEDGGILWHGITRDISETKAHQAYLFQLGHIDEGTGLPNRRYLNDTLDTTIREVAADGGIGVLIQVDLDEFSQVNDAYGHLAGDLILVALAQRLSADMADECFLARLGGDEFAVLYRSDCPTLEDSRQSALSLVNRICELIGQPVKLDHMVYTPRCSAGVALFSGTESMASDVMREADTALNRAKRMGRGRAVVFEGQMFADTRTRLVLTQDLTNALERGQIQVDIQTQFDSQRRPVGGELLLRWHHPVDGWISPAVFIPLAEETGLIHKIGDFVLRQACSLLQRMPVGVDIALSVNVSPAQFMATDYVARVSAIVAEYTIDLRRLTLEVTESLLVYDTNAGRQKMQELSRLGLSFSIDDFGTGYSSLAYLKTMPITELKIDQSFVRGIPGDGGDVAIVQAVLSMARYLNLRVVAEGVEKDEQFDFLVANGCQMVQGFLLARPVAADVWLNGWVA